MKTRAMLVAHGLPGRTVCGTTIGVGRELFTMETTLIVHATVAPLTFAALSWHYFRRYPNSCPLATSLALPGLVAGLDALVVAPFLERSYAMFGSPLGT